jgi:hypothetical protein
MATTKQRIHVAARQQLPEGDRLIVDVADRTIGIFRVDGKLYMRGQVIADIACAVGRPGGLDQNQVFVRVGELDLATDGLRGMNLKRRESKFGEGPA